MTFGAQDSELTAKMKDGDMDGLAAQNSYLRDALEACRKQISELTQQVPGKSHGMTPLPSFPRCLML